MPRLTLFAKGNVDLHDTLHSCRVGGEMLWNGINEILRESHPDTLIRIRHETCTRSDALLEATGVPPAELSELNLSLGMYPATSQFSTAVFETTADIIALSMQPDVTTGLVRHQAGGFLLYPYGLHSWSDPEKTWLEKNCIRTAPLTCHEMVSNFIAIIERIRQITDAPILVFNMSPIIPGETIHCFQGLGEAFSTRVRRFNLGLIEVSDVTGVSIIDVDTIIARVGADAHKLDAVHLMPTGYRLIAEEVVRVLTDLGILEAKSEVACAAA
ncbi:MAG TPA: hypothetical protein VLU73_01575 [Methylococcaceae bacterium]|nr:hypothetical protein [Methylococcaceae bacterium]